MMSVHEEDTTEIDMYERAISNRTLTDKKETTWSWEQTHLVQMPMQDKNQSIMPLYVEC